MPIYEYKCNQCGCCFEQLSFASDGDRVFACPSCGNQETTRLMSAFRCGSRNLADSIGGGQSGCSPSGGFS